MLADPYELFRFRNTRGQLARRGRDLHFARYHVERTDERKEFVAAVKYLLEVDLSAHLRRWRWFAEGGVACIGCAFTEVIEVTPSQMEVAACSRVECPECLAISRPKGAIVKFPWHPKRVTRTPNHGLRWVKRESDWSLSE